MTEKELHEEFRFESEEAARKYRQQQVEDAWNRAEQAGEIRELVIPVETDRVGDAQHGTALVPVEALSGMITEMMRPVMQSIGKILENNTAALEQISAAQSIQNDRLEALEKQIRLQTTVTDKQVTYLNAAIKGRSRELLDKKGIEDAKAVTKLGNLIRKAVLLRYGIENLRKVPKHEYNVALQQISIWNDLLAVRDIVREFRDRSEGGAHGEQEAAATDL